MAEEQDNIDADLEALKAAVEALKRCSSKRGLRATINFIVDYFIDHPSAELPEHLR